MGEAADDHIAWLIAQDCFEQDEDGALHWATPLYDMHGDIHLGAVYERHAVLQAYFRLQAEHIKSGGVSRDALALGMKLKAAGIAK